ncbi:MAG: hypothetical protein RMJ66_07085, partial [Bacteroidia bacterium]|nr:hypothetical protein [Bacteroidia bacterium]
MGRLVGVGLLLLACAQRPASSERGDSQEGERLLYPKEKHFRNVRQLTFGGNNAEGYFDPTAQRIVFQSDWIEINPQGCDQVFLMDLRDSILRYRRI